MEGDRMAGGRIKEKSQNSLSTHHAMCYAQCPEVAYIFSALVVPQVMGILLSI